MRFIDHCRIKVVAGDGGNGAAAFRREKFIPFGGPSGGDGGRGGNVTLVADEGLSTLQDVTYQRTIVADRGGHGLGSDMYGRGGVDRVEKVPIGTQVFDDETDELIGDMVETGQELLVAKGGQGGRGNIHFATSFDRAPRRAEKGARGESRTLRLELKIMADVGLLGFPNVGKSTFVASVSAARPKIADYPFTTMVPTLGVVEMHGGQRLGGSSFVIADIPGLIPGASEGTGLGIQFLKHVERTRALLHLITLDFGEGREPLEDYVAIRAELAKFSPELSERPEVVALSKIDIPEVREAFGPLSQAFARKGIRLRAVSAATREGLDELLLVLERVVRGTSTPEDLSVPIPAGSKKPKAREQATTKTPKPEAKPKSKPSSKSVPKSKSKPSSKSQSKSKPSSQSKSVSKSKPSSQSKSVSKSQSKPSSQSKSKPSSKLVSTSLSKTKSKSKPASKLKTATKSKPSSKLKPASKSRSKPSTAKARAPSRTKAAAKRVSSPSRKSTGKKGKR